MRTISLFSGCGGMDIGAKNAGVEVVLANDIMQAACESLTKYFPETKIIHKSIADIESFPKAELVMGGYPCQSFSMGGNRKPSKDSRTYLYQEFARCLEKVNPLYFMVENVDGLGALQKGKFLKDQLAAFNSVGAKGYRITARKIDVKDYGIPQGRKRLVIMGVRKDLGKVYRFPDPTHGKATKKNPGLLPYVSHGEAIKGLPLWPTGEFYERPHDLNGHWAWYYMSRNRKRPWDEPSYTIVANWRHVTLHPAGPKMELIWSNLADGSKQKWDFSDEYEHIEADPSRPVLKGPRRLSWRECALIQTFPKGFEPTGAVESKFTQIGNAFPPEMAKILLSRLVTGEGLTSSFDPESKEKKQYNLW